MEQGEKIVNGLAALSFNVFTSAFALYRPEETLSIQLHRISIPLRRASFDSIAIIPNIVVTNPPLNTPDYQTYHQTNPPRRHYRSVTVTGCIT